MHLTCMRNNSWSKGKNMSLCYLSVLRHFLIESIMQRLIHVLIRATREQLSMTLSPRRRASLVEKRSYTVHLPRRYEKKYKYVKIIEKKYAFTFHGGSKNYFHFHFHLHPLSYPARVRRCSEEIP